MQFIKNFFKHDSVIGLSGLRKKTNQIQLPMGYKKTLITNTEKNYLLI